MLSDGNKGCLRGIHTRLSEDASHGDVMQSAAGRDPDQLSFEVCDGANFRVAHQVEERPIDKAHHDSRVDAAYVGHHSGSYGRSVLDVTAKKHLDVEGCRHEHHLNV